MASKEVGLCYGKAAFYVLFEGQLFERIRELLREGNIDAPHNRVSKELYFEINTIHKIRFLGPVFRTIYQILKHQPENSYDNASFLRTQLSREELIFIALNILYDQEGRDGLSIYVKKFGILKHLTIPFLREEVIEEYGPECFGRKFAKKYYEGQTK